LDLKNKHKDVVVLFKKDAPEDQKPAMLALQITKFKELVKGDMLLAAKPKQ